MQGVVPNSTLTLIANGQLAQVRSSVLRNCESLAFFALHVYGVSLRVAQCEEFEATLDASLSVCTEAKNELQASQIAHALSAWLRSRGVEVKTNVPASQHEVLDWLYEDALPDGRRASVRVEHKCVIVEWE